MKEQETKDIEVKEKRSDFIGKFIMNLPINSSDKVELLDIIAIISKVSVSLALSGIINTIYDKKSDREQVLEDVEERISTDILTALISKLDDAEKSIIKEEWDKE